MSIEKALYGLWEELSPGSVQFRILVEGQPKALKPAIQEQIYMIVREAMLNALRHSGASTIEAELEYLPRRLRVVVRDNGCGIDPRIVQSGRDSHWGLWGMRDRAESVEAVLRIWSRPGGGTEVEISVPIQIGRS
jgi:signal transduction histidine kinase